MRLDKWLWHARFFKTRSLAQRYVEKARCRLDGFDLAPPPRFRAIAGPQSNYFSEEEIASFFESEFIVSEGSDRMGMRINGRRLVHSRSLDFTSDGIAPGSIQVPGSGQPIVLLVDRQTTGGYPKIATVVSDGRDRRSLRADRAGHPLLRRRGAAVARQQPGQRRRRRTQLGHVADRPRTT